MSMITKLLFSILACLVALIGIVLLIFLSYLIIRDIIEELKRWCKGDDWGWIEILEEYGYQDIYG